MRWALGWQTALLLEATAILVPVAGSLWCSLKNRAASRTLAGLLFILIGVFTPWTIGYAGLYDRWQSLTYLPVSNPLWVPALLYLYIYVLVQGSWPPFWRRLLLPGAIQFTYQAVCFGLPLHQKLAWSRLSAKPVDVLFGTALIAAFLLQTRASLRLLAIYRAAASNALSDDARDATRWLTRSVWAFASVWIAWALAILLDAVLPIGYSGFMFLYLLIAAFAIYLGVEGWRHTLLKFPTLAVLQPAGTATQSRGRDWKGQGEAWAATLRQAGWTRDPDLTLATVARHLGTNTAYLSRAFNEGLGMNFSTLVNQMRSHTVAEALRSGAPQDILELALDAGFASKASFNRAFSTTFGCSPSAYRRDVSNSENPEIP